MAASTTPAHRWHFFRAGGFDQVKLETGADLMCLDQLDQKLWVALACPLSGQAFDLQTAALIDTDHDGRIRAPELIAAVKWAGRLLKDPDVLVERGDSLSLAAIQDASPEGAHLVAAAQHILEQAGRPGATAISLADATAAAQTFAGTLFNGDGVIVPESASEPSAKAVLEEIAARMGTVPDRSGKPGIDQTKTDAFFAQCAACDAWWQAAEKDAANILPLGPKTVAAAASVKAAKAKVDDYFGRCRLAAFDARAALLLNRKEEEYAAIVSRDISIDVSELAGFPLAQAAAGKPLPLAGAVNPAHAAMLAALRDEAVAPLLGETVELTEAGWASVQSRLAPFIAWQAAQSGAAVAPLGQARVRALLAGPAQKDVNALIARDKSFENQAAAIADVEKLIRYVRDLHLLCINFVNFKNLYAGSAPAIFQAGVLYLDQRSCHLCLNVDDPGRHSAMAGLAGAFLAYADCVRKGTGQKMSIVAIFSQGDDENLMVGRNGIFYDRNGLDYDATITKILANPVSLREAFWSPYKKVVRLIEQQVSKSASAADAAAQGRIGAIVEGAAPVKPKLDLSVVALISVAAGSLTVAFTGFLVFLKEIPAWQLPLIALGIMLIISGPSLLVAYVKLRRRNLGPILDANGWAINTSARINVPFGSSLTEIAELPPGASVDLRDRFAETSSGWARLAWAVFLIVWLFAFVYDMGFLYSWTKDWVFPLGKPPASHEQTVAKDKTPPTNPTDAGNAKK